MKSKTPQSLPNGAHRWEPATALSGFAPITFPKIAYLTIESSSTIYKLAQFLDGDMDEVLDALITADTAQKLQAQNDTV